MAALTKGGSLKSYPDKERIHTIAEIVARLPQDTTGLNFYSVKTSAGEVALDDMYPKLGHPHAVDFFFFGTLHDHGFWFGDHRGYQEPLYGKINRKEKVKGSDLMWKSLKLAFDCDNRVVTPEYLSRISPKDFKHTLSDDDGPIVFPDWEARYILTKKYATWFFEHKTHPSHIVQEANDSSSPLFFFSQIMKKVPGYDDPFMKKTYLLAMALSERPEKFLKITDPEHWMPIVDYHLMRLALRMGMVVVRDKELKGILSRREWIDASDEEEIRMNTLIAMKEIMRLSKKPFPLIDNAFWKGRKFCPEMETPNCGACIFKNACEKKTELFQPVFRTTNY